MKCKECKYCYRGLIKDVPDVYVCVSTKEPFIIGDVNIDRLICGEKKTDDSYKNNANKIRSMTDEELAKLLMSGWFVDEVCRNCEGDMVRCGEYEFCESKVLKWLQSEVKK